MNISSLTYLLTYIISYCRMFLTHFPKSDQIFKITFLWEGASWLNWELSVNPSNKYNRFSSWKEVTEVAPGLARAVQWVRQFCLSQVQKWDWWSQVYIVDSSHPPYVCWSVHGEQLPIIKKAYQHHLLSICSILCLNE